MYMESITAAKAPYSATQRRAVGSLLILLSLMVMLPWLIVLTAYAVTTFGVRALMALPRTLTQAADYLGDRTLGR